jgi:general secretion pathway protein I
VRAERTVRGFTLIGVLAALVIVALGMLGVIEAVTQTARNGTYLRERTLAHWVAMNVVTERRLLPNPPDVAESSDEVEFAGERWRWSLTVTQTAVESMRRLDVRVRRSDAPETSSLASVTGFYGTALRPGLGQPLSWDAEQGGSDGDGDTDGGGQEAGDSDEHDTGDTGDDGDDGGDEEDIPGNDEEPPEEPEPPEDEE